MCRPGRLDKLLYVDLPNADERAEITKTMLRGVPIASAPTDGTTSSTEEALQALVRARCEGYSGADLAALVREAGVLALRETLRMLDFSFSSSPSDATERAKEDEQEKEMKVEVTLRHFENALEKVMPSVSSAQRRKYEALRSKFAGLPVRGGRKDKAVEGEGDSSSLAA